MKLVSSFRDADADCSLQPKNTPLQSSCGSKSMGNRSRIDAIEWYLQVICCQGVSSG